MALYMCGSGGKTKFLGGQNFLFFIFIFLFLISSPKCGIDQLSLSLFVSSSWSTSITAIIFSCGATQYTTLCVCVCVCPPFLL